MSSPFTIALAARIESHVAAANGTGQAGDAVGVKVPASCLAATRCMEVADVNLGAYRRRTIVRCWRSGYVRYMSPLRRDSQTSCTHPEPACTRSSGRLLVILYAEGSIWGTNGAAREKWMPRVWPSRRSERRAPEPGSGRTEAVGSARAIARCAPGRRRKPSASRATDCSKAVRAAQPCLPPCAHKPAQCRRLPATDTVLTFPVSPMLRAHIHACAPALASRRRARTRTSESEVRAGRVQITNARVLFIPSPSSSDDGGG